jgi:hypothetical protein
MDKKTIGLAAIIIVIVALASVAVAFVLTPTISPRTPTGPLDFTVTGQSDCLRFLNSSVPVVYVPFTIAANEQWQLTVNCTQMPGGVNGWTDVYIFQGYWGCGANHTCKASDLYPILGFIQSTDTELRLNAPYTQTFNDTTTQSYTLFFVFPPGGPATFHITLKPAA